MLGVLDPRKSKTCVRSRRNMCMSTDEQASGRQKKYFSCGLTILTMDLGKKLMRKQAFKSYSLYVVKQAR